jgi:hypothetical protein
MVCGAGLFANEAFKFILGAHAFAGEVFGLNEPTEGCLRHYISPQHDSGDGLFEVIGLGEIVRIDFGSSKRIGTAKRYGPS